nr:unnamed protein product [Callosobruchus chinensis]
MVNCTTAHSKPRRI